MKSQRRQYVDKKLVRRVRLFAIVFLVMTGIGSYDVIIGNLDFIWAMCAMAGGIGIGVLLGKSVNVVWHEEAGKAMTKMDVFGIIILVLYIFFALLRKKIFGHWLQGNQLSAFIICLSAGVMLGRVLTLRLRILKILKGKGL